MQSENPVRIDKNGIVIIRPDGRLAIKNFGFYMRNDVKEKTTAEQQKRYAQLAVLTRARLLIEAGIESLMQEEKRENENKG